MSAKLQTKIQCCIVELQATYKEEMKAGSTDLGIIELITLSFILQTWQLNNAILSTVSVSN